jgi:hypothetical protein
MVGGLHVYARRADRIPGRLNAALTEVSNFTPAVQVAYRHGLLIASSVFVSCPFTAACDDLRAIFAIQQKQLG